MSTSATGPSAKLIKKAVKERESRESGRSRTVAVLLLLALAALGLVLVFAVYPGHPGDTSAPQCNGATMSPGDTCEQYVNGALTNTYSYQDMLQQQQADHPAALVAGIVAVAIAALAFAPALRALNPAKPWGTGRSVPCPRCQRPNLREKLMVHSETHGRARSTWRGIVTLCAPGCDFATVRQR